MKTTRKAKKKMGRPALPEAVRRGVIVTLRMRPADAATLDEDCRRAGLSRSDYLTRCWQRARRKER